MRLPLSSNISAIFPLLLGKTIVWFWGRQGVAEILGKNVLDLVVEFPEGHLFEYINEQGERESGAVLYSRNGVIHVIGVDCICHRRVASGEYREVEGWDHDLIRDMENAYQDLLRRQQRPSTG